MRKILFFLLLSSLLVIGCDDFGSWTTSPTALLTFSTDTVAFDTIITGQSSTTKTLIIGNKNKSGIRIKQVALQQGENSPFRVNVDGQYLYNGEGTDFEVRGKDSIYVRAEVTLPEGDGSAISHHEDKLTFLLESGTRQEVTLVADGMDVYILTGKVIESDTTLQNDRPILVRDSLVVSKSATLTLLPGTTLMFHDGVSLSVHGTLDAQGTIDQPIIFRGDRVDNLFDYLPYDNTPNRWGGIHLYGDSHDNVLVQCDVHSGDYGIRCDSTELLDAQRPTLLLQNSVIHNVAGNGLDITDCVAYVIGTQISNTLGQTVRLLGGVGEFIQCTIAQFYPWNANRGDALYLANLDDDDNYHPIYWATFANCVITGYADDVIMGKISEGNGYSCDYIFRNSLLRTEQSEDTERFVNVVYDNKDLEVQGKDHFTLFDTDNFLYRFVPDSTSALRGLADIEYTKQYSTVDRRGVNRLADGAPDAGAYEGE